MRFFAFVFLLASSVALAGGPKDRAALEHEQQALREEHRALMLKKGNGSLPDDKWALAVYDNVARQASVRARLSNFSQGN